MQDEVDTLIAQLTQTSSPAALFKRLRGK